MEPELPEPVPQICRYCRSTWVAQFGYEWKCPYAAQHAGMTLPVWPEAATMPEPW